MFMLTASVKEQYQMSYKFEKAESVINGIHVSTDKITISLDPPGPRLNIKTVLSTYGDFHVKDKTAVRTSYL